MTQTTLNFDAPPVDPNIHPEDVSRAGTQSAAILERLQQGPATNIELNSICYRYSARIHDLRKRGVNIRTKRMAGAIWQFWLE